MNPLFLFLSHASGVSERSRCLLADIFTGQGMGRGERGHLGGNFPIYFPSVSKLYSHGFPSAYC